MIQLPSISRKPVVVLGLGRSGLASTRALLASGNSCWAWDDNPAARATAQADGIALTDLTRCELSETDTLVLSPGIPHTYPAPHPLVERARAAGCEVIGDGELLARAGLDADYVGITGTHG
jgi:UDP-N-acetylmuramoylalanine--D-glutamate ligase